MMAARFATVLLAAFFAHCFAAPAEAADAARLAVQNRNATDLSAQERRYYVRPRVRIYRYPQPPFWEYPRPGTYSWPGPGAKRDCAVRYVVENRPSGAVMTPRMQCAWVPG
ncbi:MAG: hypothetical protein ABUL48_05765 [Pseudorhodoplanes sp.]